MNDIDKPLHVVELRAENIKRIRAVSIRPQGHVVTIAGDNGQGKSSCIDSIEYALAGARSIPLEPIRHGARKARVVVDLGEIVVERTFSPKGTELVVRGKDGLELASPQRLLDSLCSKVCFDPLAFARMEPAKQDETLKKMLGLDFSDIQAARAKVYDQRTAAGREVARLEALLDDLEEHPDAPEEPISVAELTAELQRITEAASKRTWALRDLERRREQLKKSEDRIADLESQLAAERAHREEIAAALQREEAAIPPEPPSPDEVRAKLNSAEATNAKVRANAERTKLEKQLQTKTSEVETLTGRIEELDAEKQRRLAAAKFPIDGLGFDDAGPTFNGVPIAQISQAERLRISTAIGAAMNPRLRVMMVREGAFLDKSSMALIEALAEETGFQLWVERVGDGDPGAVIIHDGEVRQDKPDAEEPIVAAG